MVLTIRPPAVTLVPDPKASFKKLSKAFARTDFLDFIPVMTGKKKPEVIEHK